MKEERNTNSSDGWERAALQQVALEVVREQRRTRRWNIFFRAAFLLYLIALLVVAMPSCQERRASSPGPHTAVVKIEGMIADGASASADLITEGLRAAFAAEDVAGVIVQIDSPGGSPVQAGIVNDEIKRLRAEYPDIPIYAVVGDMCTSGAYYIAAAADEIYVDKASLVGSIGVLIDSFGVTGAMDKLGIERRLYTAGRHKGLLDPFSPEQPDQLAHVQTLLDDVHTQFIDVVKEGRGERLADDAKLFSGLIWSGQQSIALGLADATGNLRSVAREVIGAEALIDYTPRLGLWARLADELSASIANHLELRLHKSTLR